MGEGLAHELALFAEALRLPTVGMAQVEELEALRSLVRRYPDRARRATTSYAPRRPLSARRTIEDVHMSRLQSGGWVRAGDANGVPLWKRGGEACYVATRDMDQPRFLGAALAWFDQMSGPELRAFVQRHSE